MSVGKSSKSSSTLYFVWPAILAFHSMVTVVMGQESSPPALKIETTGKLVANPGGAVNITIVSPAGAKFLQVAVAGESPLASMGDVVTEVPGQLAVKVAADVRPGSYKLTAIGTTTEGQMVESASVILDVQTRDIPVRLTAEPPEINFASHGQQQAMTILGTYADGTVVDVTSASQLAYVSSNPDVVTVDEIDRNFSGVGAGKAIVTAFYGGESTGGPQVSIPVRVPPPSVVPSPDVLYFDDQPVGQRSSQQSVGLSNNSTRELEIESVDIHGDFSATDNCVSASPLPPGSSCMIVVRFSPSRVGPQKGTIEIKNNAMMIPARIKLRGNGIASDSTGSRVLGPRRP